MPRLSSLLRGSAGSKKTVRQSTAALPESIDVVSDNETNASLDKKENLYDGRQPIENADSVHAKQLQNRRKQLVELSDESNSNNNERSIRLGRSSSDELDEGSIHSISKRSNFRSAIQSVPDELNESMSSIRSDASVSRRGRRTGNDNDASAKRREERRNIANKLRSKNLVKAHSVSNLNGDDDGENDSVCSSSSSLCSKSSACSKSSRSSRSSSVSRSRSNRHSERGKKTKEKDIMAIQFSASISDALECDEDLSNNSLWDSVSNIDNDGTFELSDKLLNPGSLDGSFNEDDILCEVKVNDADQTQRDLEKRPKKEKDSKKKSKSKDGGKGDDEKTKKKDKEKQKEKRDKDKSRETEKDKKKQKKATNRKLKSCLKKRASTRKSTKAVHFETECEPSECKENIHVIKPLFKYAKDLWWSDEEIEDLRLAQADFSKASDEVKRQVQAYMQAFKNGRHEVKYIQDLSPEIYQELLAGMKRGFCGIETHSNLYETICQSIKETVQSVVKTYKKQIALASDPSASARARSMDPLIMVKAHSEALTESDRHWAAAMGKVEEEAQQHA